MAAVVAGVSALDQRSVSVEDVTEQYVDLGIRLENKKALEARYRNLLARAQNVEDVLAVEKQLGPYGKKSRLSRDGCAICAIRWAILPCASLFTS